MEFNWWRCVWDMNPAWKGGHGGGQETAAILAIDERLVKRESFEAVVPKGIAPHMPAAAGTTWYTAAYTCPCRAPTSA
jgi:creatinine amidohydrolase